MLARLHAIPDADATLRLPRPRPTRATPCSRATWRGRAWYEWAAADVGRSPLVDRALAWLEANLPDTSDDTVLCWGDARIGNTMYRDFEPVAVLDWEMAALGPRELDVSWMVFAHRSSSRSPVIELPGMPHFLREEDVRATYARVTGASLAT